MKVYDLIIVGAGPAGMTAAIAASEQGGDILLLDGASQVGKKILVTGNGRCNLTNQLQEEHCYRSDDPEQAQAILRQFNDEDTHAFFRSLGIVTRNKNGYIYPYNEQASAVRDAFESKLRSRKNITVRTESYVEEIQHRDGAYFVFLENETFISKTLLLTTGGFAGPKVGCDGSGFRMAESLGHKIVAPLPALTPLKSSAPFLKKASGVRNQARITLLIDGEVISQEEGELQWTDYGISGVAIFQLSRHAILALEEEKNVELHLDFLPDYEKEEFFHLMMSLIQSCLYKNVAELLSGFMPSKLVSIIVREAGIHDEVLVTELKEEEIQNLLNVLKCFPLRINGYMGYEKAQVTRGGICLKELTDSLESKIHSGLFFAGELVDVDGTCGGYNLQWAFSSGYVAGSATMNSARRSPTPSIQDIPFYKIDSLRSTGSEFSNHREKIRSASVDDTNHRDQKIKSSSSAHGKHAMKNTKKKETRHPVHKDTFRDDRNLVKKNGKKNEKKNTKKRGR